MACRVKLLALPLILSACLCVRAAAISFCSEEDPVTQKEKSPLDGNPSLVHAMDKVASSDNPENRKELYEALLGSMLLVPVPEIPAGLNPGFQTTKSDTQIHLISVLNGNQIRVTAVFTDLEALRNWDPSTQYLGIKAHDLFRIVMGTDIQEIAINPYDPIRKMIRPGGRVTRREIEMLSNGVAPTSMGPKIAQLQLKANERVFIGIPAHPPSTAVEELLKNKASSLTPIAELYVFQMATQAGSSHTVIGMVLSEELAKNQKDEIVKSMGISVHPQLKPDESLDFLFLQGSMLDQVRALGTLIFRRP